MDKILKFENVNVQVSNYDKVFWPEEGYTKGDLVEYYLSISKYLLPYLKNRPESLHRFPDGINGQDFYHKDYNYAPAWLETKKIEDEKIIDYLLCQDEKSLAFIINLGCIDLNPWLSKIPTINKPDFAVLDLDPLEIEFNKVIEVAKVSKEVFDRLDIKAYLKTSGATGLHIFIPLGAKYTFEQSRQFSEILANLINKEIPEFTSVERSPEKRKGKVYLDFLQNAENQTVAAVYSVRPFPKAPVSMPLKWEELDDIQAPSDFNIKNATKRIPKINEYYKVLLKDRVDLKTILKKVKS